MNNINFAIVGCGRIAQRHAKHISKYANLVAVCDIVEAKAEELGVAYGATSYRDFEQMIQAEQGLDVVSVCTPNGLHARHSIMALNAKINVLCEKPLALSVHDCGEMIKSAENNNVRIFAVKQNRFNPPVVKLKQLLDKGALGNISSVQLTCLWNRGRDYYERSWKGGKDMDGGTLFTQFSHFVDLLYWMFGDVESVKGFSANAMHDYIDFEDCGSVSIRFRSGVIGSIHFSVNAHEKNYEGSLTVLGEKGTVKIGGQYLNELEYQNIEGIESIVVDPGNAPNSYGTYQGSMSNHGLVYENLISVLEGSGPISANVFDAMKTVEIIERIYREIR